MKIDICPNLDRIRFFARSALYAWDYQDLESGRDQVIADMEALLKYLVRCFQNNAPMGSCCISSRCGGLTGLGRMIECFDARDVDNEDAGEEGSQHRKPKHVSRPQGVRRQQLPLSPGPFPLPVAGRANPDAAPCCRGGT
jgi:hypothetical protein